MLRIESFSYTPPQTVYDGPADISHPISRTIQRFNAATKEALASIARQRPGVVEFNTKYVPRGFRSSLRRIAAFPAYVQAYVGVEFAEKRANQLHADHSNVFAKEYQKTLDRIDHHGTSHVKRTRAGIKNLDRHTPEIYIPQWIKDAQLRFAPEHDANQAYQEYRILQGELSEKIDSKHGHGLGGAAMTLVRYKEYAKLLHIPEEKAKKVS